METRESPPDVPGSSLTAHEALAAVADVNHQVLARLKAHGWYSIALGGLVGGLCFSMTLPLIGQLIALVVYGPILATLARTFIRRTGIWVNGYRAGRTRWVTIGAVTIAAMGILTNIYVVSTLWIAALIAAGVAVVLSAGGWAWEAAYRRDLAESA